MSNPIENQSIDLRNDPNAIIVQKRPIECWVTFASRDGVCKTLEGEVSYRQGDAIMTGVEGEQWPIAKAVFERNYERLLPAVSAQGNTVSSETPNPIDTEMNQNAGFVELQEVANAQTDGIDVQAENGSAITIALDGYYKKRPMNVLARQLTEVITITVAGGQGHIKGEAGDWLLQYAVGDQGVVRADIFTRTYEIVTP